MRVDCMYRLVTEAPGYQACTTDAPFQRVEPGFPSPTVFLDAARSPLNPHWFPLGSMIIYVLLAIKLVLAPIMTMDLQDLAIVGRTLSALADFGTVALVYALGKRLYSRGAGLLAATLVAFAVVHIQQSHFYRPETFTMLFTLASFWFMLNVIEQRRLRGPVFLGLFVGLSFATKLSVLPLLLPLAVVYGYLLRQAKRTPSVEQSADQVEKVVLRALTAGAVAVAVYLFWTPYALLDFPEFLGWNLRELDIVRNAGTVPYTVQYIGAPRFLYELRQTTLWGLGLPLGLLAWGGLLAAVVLNLRRPRIGQVLVLLWAIPLLLTVGSVEVKFLRYTFPLMPVIILLGSGTALMGVQWLKERIPRLGLAAAAAVGVVVAATVLYALAFTSIYSSPHTAVQASRWINANVTFDKRILTDNHWDEGIPDLGRYRVTQLPMFEGDTSRKMDSVAAQLAGGDYLVFYSNRTYGAIARVPERYPFSSTYYQLLFSGELGYELEKSFSAYPRFLGVALKDDTFSRPGLPVPDTLETSSVAPLTLDLGYADNDVITYDHPLVLVFRNMARYDREHLLGLILTSAIEVQPPLTLMLTPEELETQQQGGTWSTLFNDNSLSNRLPIAVWLLLVEAAALAVLPLGFLVFRGLSDRGYLLTKIMAILLLAYLPWLLSALHLMDFGRTSIYLVLLALGLTSGVVAVLHRRQMAAFLRDRWRTLAWEEVLFLAAFLAFVAIRWANPDLWHPFRGGEKPMDFAYLNAVVRSTAVPPYDPWFAGGYLNYYYFGQFIVATLIKATGILPEVAYNLAVPLLFALMVGGVFSVVYNLTHALRQRRADRQGPAWGPAAAGMAAVFLVAVLGNLGGGVQLVRTVWVTVTSSPPLEGDVFHIWFWSVSRMMPGQISITEFPLWSFLFADLHAHLIVIPFTLLVVGLSLNLVLIAEESGLRWRRIALPLALLALTAGSLAAINTWDYPTFLVLAMSAVLLASYVSRRKLDRLFITQAAVGVGALVVLSYVAFLPFHLRNVAFNAGVHASAEQTDVHHYLAIHGLFLFIIVSYLAYTGRKYLGRFISPGGFPGVHSQGLIDAQAGVQDNKFTVIFIAASAALALYLMAAGYATVALLFLLALVVVFLAAGWLMEENREAPYHLFLLALVGGAFGLGMVVDVVTVNNDIDRMNTVFKLYLQTWVLFGLASATALWYLATAAHLSWSSIRWAKGVWLGLLLVLVAGAAVFPLVGTRFRLAERFSTEFTGLNGAQYMQDGVYRDTNGLIALRWDWEAIQWLRENVEGSPVIAEGNTAPHNYRWGSRVSIYTGMPTIVGWGWHQTQQRSGEEGAVRRRLAEVNQLFSTTDEARALQILRDYNVRYIYIGKLEQLYYPQAGLAKFRRMEDRGVSLFYSNPEVAIYEVNLGTV